MKIAITGNKLLREQLESRHTAEAIEWVHTETPEEFDQHQDAELFIDLNFTNDPHRISELAKLLPAPVLVNAVSDTLQEIGRPFIRINAWPGFAERPCDELVAPDEETAVRLSTVYNRLGWRSRFVADIPGMVTARIIAAIINEAYYTLQAEVSTKEEIDTAMRLGTNYPYGPFEWSHRIGLNSIHHLLCVLSKEEERYSPAEALLAELGLKFS